jgi:integrase
MQVKSDIIINDITEQNEWYKQDVWHAKEIGLEGDPTNSRYLLNFTSITPLWLKDIAKRYIKYRLAIRSFNSCAAYLLAIKVFSEFIRQSKQTIYPTSITRKLILEYIEYLSTTTLTTISKSTSLINLRSFIEIVAREEWVPFSKERLIYNDELPERVMAPPRFIPESVMLQLEKHLTSLPDHHRRFIVVLKETGRRINEVCNLSINCLTRDNENDPFLEIKDKKMKKNYFIPISKECELAILEQQEWLKIHELNKVGFLFVSRWHGSKDLRPPKSRQINYILDTLAKEKNITDLNGDIWHFSTHQFRHTIGTRMINANVPQPIIQRYLGHKSPAMTNRYAYIYNKTMKESFHKFQDQLVNIKGEIINETAEQLADQQWLKHNIMLQTLPNGYCSLPTGLRQCPHANSCLTCGNFVTNKDFLSQHECQLKKTCDIIEIAIKNDWHKQMEINTTIKLNLESIIKTLLEQKKEQS